MKDIRSIRGRMSSRSLCDVIADAWVGGDDRRVAELAPQAADGHRDGVGERVGVFVPDLLEQVLGAEVRGAGAQQRLQNSELLDGKVKQPPVAGSRAADRVELDAGGAQGAGP